MFRELSPIVLFIRDDPVPKKEDYLSSLIFREAPEVDFYLFRFCLDVKAGSWQVRPLAAGRLRPLEVSHGVDGKRLRTEKPALDYLFVGKEKPFAKVKNNLPKVEQQQSQE